MWTWNNLTVRLLLFLFAFLLLAGTAIPNGEGTEKIPASKQRVGDAKAGYQYLTTGDYVGSGIPFDT